MNEYRRLLSFLKPYKRIFVVGVVLALFASVFNGIALTSLKPIFDILQYGAEKPYQLRFTPQEAAYLSVKYPHRIEILMPLQPVVKIKKPAVVSSVEEKYIRLPALLKLKLNEFMKQFHPLQFMVGVAVAVLPVYLLRMASVLGTAWFLNSAALQAVRDIREALYQRMLVLPLSLFVREKSGTLTSRMVNDVSVVTNSLVLLEKFIFNIFTIITHVGLLIIISYKLVLITFIAVPIVILPVNAIARKVKRSAGNEQTGLGTINGHMHELISGIRVIRAFGMETHNTQKFDSLNNYLLRQTLKNRFYHVLGPSIVEFASSFIVVGLIAYGGVLILGGEMSAGSFFLFLFTIMVIMSPLKAIANWYSDAQRSGAAAGRIFEIMQMHGEVHETQNPQPLEKLHGSIQFEKVGFAYEGTQRKVLQGIQLEVPVGSMVALVGHSGAGKSTLVDLIPRFYDPVDGKILSNGKDIREYSLKEWRSRIGIVTQDVFLFNGTIAENIAYGREDISRDEIIKAAKMAYAEEFISKLPNGYDTQVGERGLMLSGGQRQRISIARALLKDPEILILDEATSALDTESERLVQKALRKLMKHRTTFVIAHRLSTVFEADMIFVMSKGKVVETGTHATLLSKSGQYKKLYDMQFQE